MESKHIFAIYADLNPEFLTLNSVIEIKDKDLLHRLNTVLRLKPEENLILFNKQYTITVKLISYAKNSFKIFIENKTEITPIAPKINILLPILKRDALETAVYSCVELGVNNIQLIVTDKSQKSLSERDYERLHRIMISAAEQSKQFMLPDLPKAINYKDAILKYNSFGYKLVCDVDGQKLSNIISGRNFSFADSFVILLGPEGGLTLEELELAKKSYFNPIVLTSTILRALQAVALSAGIIRSLR